jgi:hypothetical protein
MSTGDKIKKGEESQLQLRGFGEIRPGRSDHHDATRPAHMPHGLHGVGGGSKFQPKSKKKLGKNFLFLNAF